MSVDAAKRARGETPPPVHRSRAPRLPQGNRSRIAHGPARARQRLLCAATFISTESDDTRPSSVTASSLSGGPPGTSRSMVPSRTDSASPRACSASHSSARSDRTSVRGDGVVREIGAQSVAGNRSDQRRPLETDRRNAHVADEEPQKENRTTMRSAAPSTTGATWKVTCRSSAVGLGHTLRSSVAYRKSPPISNVSWRSIAAFAASPLRSRGSGRHRGQKRGDEHAGGDDPPQSAPTRGQEVTGCGPDATEHRPS